MDLNGYVKLDLFKRGRYDLLDLESKQLEAFEALKHSAVEVVLFGGAAGGGKTYGGCLWLFFNCMAYAGTRWFVGRKELKAVRKSVYLTFQKVAKSYGLKLGEDYTYHGVDNYIQFTNGSRIDFLELRRLPQDELYERFGSEEYTGGWIEEGGEVDFDAFDTLKSRVGRHFNDKYGLKKKILITCNPKKNWLYSQIWKPWKKGTLEKNYRYIQALAKHNTRNESGYEQSLKDIKNKAKRERLLYGNWEYEDDPSQLMTYDTIGDIWHNRHVLRGKPAITADVARFGKDKTVLFVWAGFVIIHVKVLRKKDTTFVAKTIKELEFKFSIPRSRVVIDDDGIGGGVVDQLKGCKRFVNNSKSLPEKNKQQNYRNLKSQCSYNMATRVNGAGYRSAISDTKFKESLSEELEQIKDKYPDDELKPKEIISKDKVKESIGRSPDYSDTMMMREFLELKKSGAGVHASI